MSMSNICSFSLYLRLCEGVNSLQSNVVMGEIQVDEGDELFQSLQRASKPDGGNHSDAECGESRIRSSKQVQ